MSTELSNGVIIPEEYSDDWYDEMSINLRKLNDVITAASDNATDIQRLDTDKANQSDLTALTSRVSQNETDIIALQTAVSGALKREIVQTLPTEDISTTTIYMIRNSQSSGTNIYDEYMYINSQWELIGTSATDFSNYYTKNETDNLLSAKANQTDLTSLSGRVTQNETDITALQTAVSGALKREIVQSLPTQDISTTTIYMIRNTTTSGDNIYDEYMYINNLWELIGTSATDFSNYYTKTEIDTLLSYKANDSDVVHKSGNETVGGRKTFSNIIPIDGVYLGNESSTNERTTLCLRSNRDTANKSCAYISRFRSNKNQGELSDSDSSFISISFLENETRYTRCFDFGLTDWDADGIPQTYYFTSPSGKGALGTSSRKWQSINGVEPSSLSLPSGNTADRLDISSYITAFDGRSNSYTPLANGWLSISVDNSTEVYVFLNNLYGVNNSRPTAGGIRVTLPVLKGILVAIRITGGTLNFARFIPCQGNI